MAELLSVNIYIDRNTRSHKYAGQNNYMLKGKIVEKSLEVTEVFSAFLFLFLWYSNASLGDTQKLISKHTDMLLYKELCVLAAGNRDVSLTYFRYWPWLAILCILLIHPGTKLHCSLKYNRQPWECTE